MAKIYDPETLFSAGASYYLVAEQCLPVLAAGDNRSELIKLAAWNNVALSVELFLKAIYPPRGAPESARRPG